MRHSSSAARVSYDKRFAVAGRWRLFETLCLLFLLVGCKPAALTSDQALELRGVVQLKDDQLRFQPCFDTGWWPLIDDTADGSVQRFYRQLGAGGLPVYMEFIAAQADAQNRVRVSELQVAGGTESTCFFDLSNVSFRAASTSPYWVADIQENGVRVQSVEPLGSYSFPVSRQAPEGTSTEGVSAGGRSNGALSREQTFASVVSAKGIPEFKIALKPGRCIDPENGTLLNFRASMLLYGNEYIGCARQGEATEDMVSGFYKFRTGNTEALLKLHKDGRVSLVRRQQNHAVTERGTWQLLESQKLVLTMSDVSGKAFLLIFKRLNRAMYQLQGGRLGELPEGARFQRWMQSPLVWRNQPEAQPRETAEPQVLSEADTAEQKNQYSQEVRTFSFDAVKVQANEQPVQEIELLELE
ncbi:hypothetical protein [Aliamphritea spongicola]|uniref:hypothetical protein n=1 Tax=Aliamphritea spongicola TaxID=707589 RepID=UPI00196AEBBB|nr:hypothetical protein [Aliamphritea spongicola]MBN3561786.1 hypothetical protein [Aliamphritea spongicola]